MKSAFDIFGFVGKVVTNLQVLQRVVREIIEDYAKTNTKYLELRTGPKTFEGSTKAEYIDAVIQVFEEFPNIDVRLIISINRSAPMESNIEAYELAKTLIVDKKSKYIVGLEFSGDPRTNSFGDYIESIFQPARDLGIKISVHTAEIEDHHEETAKVFLLTNHLDS